MPIKQIFDSPRGEFFNGTAIMIDGGAIKQYYWIIKRGAQAEFAELF